MTQRSALHSQSSSWLTINKNEIDCQVDFSKDVIFSNPSFQVDCFIEKFELRCFLSTNHGSDLLAKQWIYKILARLKLIGNSYLGNNPLKGDPIATLFLNS
jgi:hypothetical protein